MIKNIFCLIILLYFETFAYKYPSEIIGKPAEYKPKKIRFQFQLDFRNSFVGRKTIPVAVYGVNIGIKLKDKYRYGIGFYYINQNSPTKSALNELGKQVKLTKGEYQTNPVYFASRHLLLYYGTVNFTYTLFQHKFFIIDIPLELGFGGYNIRFDDFETSKNQTIEAQNMAEINRTKLDNNPGRSGVFVPLLGGLALTIKLHRYFYPEFSGGYRKTILESDFKADFDGFYYHIGYQINFLEIYKDVFKKKSKMDE